MDVKLMSSEPQSTKYAGFLFSQALSATDTTFQALLVFILLSVEVDMCFYKFDRWKPIKVR